MHRIASQKFENLVHSKSVILFSCIFEKKPFCRPKRSHNSLFPTLYHSRHARTCTQHFTLWKWIHCNHPIVLRIISHSKDAKREIIPRRCLLLPWPYRLGTCCTRGLQHIASCPMNTDSMHHCPIQRRQKRIARRKQNAWHDVKTCNSTHNHRHRKLQPLILSNWRIYNNSNARLQMDVIPIVPTRILQKARMPHHTTHHHNT